jgi:hypothetical protein
MAPPDLPWGGIMSRTRCWIAGLVPAVILLPLVSTLAPANGQDSIHQLSVVQPGFQLARVAVPDLPAGTDAQAASDLLQKAGLSVGKIRCDSGAGASGQVTRFSPASGTMLARGAAVDIYVRGHCASRSMEIGGIATIVGIIYHPANRGGSPAPAPPPPPPPPPPSGSPPPATQTCPDGSVILVTQQCPAQPDATASPGSPDATGAGAGSAPSGPAPAQTAQPPGPAPAPQPPGPAPAPDAKPGVGGFVAPGDMEVDNWHEVQFAVAPDAVQLQVQVEGQGLAGQKPIYVAPVMRVTLLPNPDFDVQAKTNAVQAIGNDLASTWLWSVRPHKGGSETLDALVEVGRMNGNQFVAADSYTRHVPVRVKIGTWKGFLSALQNASTLGDALSTLFNSWGKTLIALTAFIGAVGGLIIAIRKVRMRKGKKT